MAMRVGLLFGGRSGEHEVSIRSAGAIAKGLATANNATKYDIIPVLIHKDGCWESGAAAQQVLDAGKPAAEDSSDIGELPPPAPASIRL